MAVSISNTPNPNALKFTVGVDVGGPQTFSAAVPTEDPLAGSLLALPEVTSVFLSADFVTLTKTHEGDWGLIAPQAQGILEAHFAT